MTSCQQQTLIENNLDHPILVWPSMAAILGVNESIIITQIHYWTDLMKREWIYNSYPAWKEQFPWMSLDKIKRTVKKLKSQGIINVTVRNKKGYDRTLSYQVNIEGLQNLMNTHKCKMPSWMSAKCTDLYQRIPETKKHHYTVNTINSCASLESGGDSLEQKNQKPEEIVIEHSQESTQQEEPEEKPIEPVDQDDDASFKAIKKQNVDNYIRLKVEHRASIGKIKTTKGAYKFSLVSRASNGTLNMDDYKDLMEWEYSRVKEERRIAEMNRRQEKVRAEQAEQAATAMESIKKRFNESEMDIHSFIANALQDDLINDFEKEALRKLFPDEYVTCMKEHLRRIRESLGFFTKGTEDECVYSKNTQTDEAVRGTEGTFRANSNTGEPENDLLLQQTDHTRTLSVSGRGTSRERESEKPLSSVSEGRHAKLSRIPQVSYETFLATYEAIKKITKSTPHLLKMKENYPEYYKMASEGRR